MIRRKLVKLHGLIDGPTESVAREMLEEESVAAVFVDVEMSHRVLQSSGRVGDGEGAVATPDHLGKAAGFEGGRHQDKVRPTIAEVREGLRKRMHRDPVGESMVGNNALEVLLIRTIGNHDNLQSEVAIVLDQLEENVGEELAAFLDGVESGGPEKDGCRRVFLKEEPLLEITLELGFDGVMPTGAIFLREIGINLRVK